MLKALIEAYVMALLESEDEEEELQTEFSGAGGIAGMTLPLGMSPGQPSEPKVLKRRKRSKP